MTWCRVLSAVPDSNAFNHAFSNVNQSFRRTRAYSDDGLGTIIWAGFAAITPKNSAGGFAYCGYPACHQT